MTLDELITACDAPSPLDGVIPTHIYLDVPKASPPGRSIRLAGRAGPLGRVCAAHADGKGFRVVATFQRSEVKAFALRLKSASE
tara:strand:+ start:5028 stop:5279 length:252 start_codon:yes stop_codon:yes gene_type:complete